MGVDISRTHDVLERSSLWGETVTLSRAEAVEDAQDFLRLLDDAGAAALGKDVDAAVEHGEARQLLLHDGARAEDVEDRDDERVRARDAARERDGSVESVILDTDEEHIGCVMVIVCEHRLARFDADVAAMIRVDGQAVLLHGGEMCAAREERHVVAGVCEIAADDAARAADAKDGEFQICGIHEGFLSNRTSGGNQNFQIFRPVSSLLRRSTLPASFVMTISAVALMMASLRWPPCAAPCSSPTAMWKWL